MRFSRVVFGLNWLVVVAAVLATAPAAALAQEDEPGSKDHPLVPRIPAYYIVGYHFNEFESFAFPLPDDREKAVEGRHWSIHYLLKEGARRSSELEILRNYGNAFRQKGWKAELYVEPNVGVFSLKTAAGEAWCYLRAAGSGDEYHVEIVEKAVMQQTVELNASELAKALDADGSVALHGILFDTGQATIKPESIQVLGAIGELLKTNAGLRLEIQGHTDNVGQAAANLTLSQQRAQAVRQHLLTTFGIAADRLTASGFGDTRPVAPNTTEEGRAENRRVELVKRR